MQKKMIAYTISLALATLGLMITTISEQREITISHMDIRGTWEDKIWVCVHPYVQIGTTITLLGISILFFFFKKPEY